MKQPTPTHDETGFRPNTLNLIFSSIEDLLNSEGNKIDTNIFQVKKLTVDDYSEIPDKITEDPCSSTVYLVKAGDVTGLGLVNASERDIREWFFKFDSVYGITLTANDEGKQTVGRLDVKVHGEYTNGYDG